MTTEKTITHEQLVSTVVEHSDGVSPSEITSDIDFADIPMDSLDIMSVFQGVEEAYDASIPDEDMHTIRNFSDLVAYLDKQGIKVS